MTGKINNKKDAKDHYLKNIFGYKKALTKGKVYPSSRTQRMRGFIETDNDGEYIIFGLLFSPKLESDIATGGEDIGDPPSLQGEKIIGQGLKIMAPTQLITRLPIC